MNVDARAEAWARLQLAGLPPRALVELLRAFGSAGGRARRDPGAAPPPRHRDRRRAPRCATRRRRGCGRRSPGSAHRATTSSPGTIPTIRARCSKSAIRRRCSTAQGRRIARCARLRHRRQPQRDAAGLRRRRGVRGGAVRGGLHDRQRSRARHRRRRASRRPSPRGQQHRGDRHRARSRLSRAESRSRARARRARARDFRVRAGHAAAEAELSAAQSARERTRARRARRRGDAVVGLAHHRATRGRAGARGVRAPGLDPLAVLERRPPADPRRREARRDRTGHPRRAQCFRIGVAQARRGPRRGRCRRRRARDRRRAGLRPCRRRHARRANRASGGRRGCRADRARARGRVASLAGGLWQRQGSGT